MVGRLAQTADASAARDADRSGDHSQVPCREPGRDCLPSASAGAQERLAALKELRLPPQASHQPVAYSAVMDEFFAELLAEDAPRWAVLVSAKDEA